MATVYKIHPAIGIARVGNSPDEFFIGPELLRKEINPQGGFKDNQCRVKRQAARFRIFAHHDDGTVSEITNNEAEITWTAHLVNSKAANPARGNSESAADLTIDPGPRTVNGPDQRQLFDTGVIKFSGAPVTNVPLGEIRSDHNSHLLVLGGFGKSASPKGISLGGFWSTPGWYDDVSDGPVTATIKLRSDNSTPPVTGSWVIVAPPKFAPHQNSVISLYDRLFETMVAAGFLVRPGTSSYSNDVYPILQRARDIGWVDRTFGSHTWSDPVTNTAIRNAIFSRLANPAGGGGNMPKLNTNTGDNTLTVTQYTQMKRWNDNTSFVNDWVGVPPPQAVITPDGLDRAALEACVGGSFFPGIETGGLDDGTRPIIVTTNYSEAFRINQAVLFAGALSNVMALPWQNDFFACADNWWPVPRPNWVIRQGVADQLFTAGLVTSAQEMVDKWHKLGFILRNGAKHEEFSRCDTSSIQLLTPVLNFQDVPQGPMGMVRETALAITFEIISPGSPVTLQYTPTGAPNHPQLIAFNSSVSAGPTAGASIAIARLWVIYRTGTAGSAIPPQTVTVQDSAGVQNWTITIIGNTVARKTAATAMVLDRSGSMIEDRGDGQSKHTSLQQAASIFVDVMLEGDGAGIVRFNQDAQVLQSIVALGSGGLSDTNRDAIKDIINGNGLDPNGQTSIGDGIFEGRGILNSATTPFDVKALVVLTDGVENSSRFIADVSSQINENTYAIGLGQPQNISVPALQAISGNNGGYLLVTGAIDTDNRFMLQKYFLQILAGISNAEIVLDPSGQLVPGSTAKVPFSLTAADSGVDVILLTPNTAVVDFRVQTPGGNIIEPWFAMAEPGMRFVISKGVSYYRLALPIEFMPDRFDAGGTWYALLTIGKPQLERGNQGIGFNTPVSRAATGMANVPDRGFRGQRANILAAEQALQSSFVNVSSSAEAARYRGSVPYSIVVHSYSNVSLEASTHQTSFEPGATIDLSATLAQSGIPLEKNAHVRVEIRQPAGTSRIIALAPDEPGEFSGKFKTTRAGIYSFRFMANGTTRSGEPFTREKTLTAGVWTGGDRPVNPGTGAGGQGEVDNSLICKLLQCLFRKNGLFNPELEKRLEAEGISIAKARECFSKFCQKKS